MRLPGVRHRALATAIALAGLAGAAIGCGSSEHRDVHPEALLDAAAARPVTSGQAEIHLRVQVEGVSALSSPLTLHLEGPYASGHGVRIPSFDWKLTAGALGFPVDGQVASTGEDVYLSVYGDNYYVGRDTIGALNARIREAGDRGTLAGVHPRTWFGRAHYEGEGNAGGVDCARIAAPLRGDAVARDLGGLSTQVGLTAPPQINGSATACVGFDDKVIHELTIEAEIEVPAADRERLGGASGAHVSLAVENSDVGEPQRISKPGGGGYRPVRDLLLTLQDFGVPIP
jgi:hypothetical protein